MSDHPRAIELRRQAAFALGFTPPAPIMISTYEAGILARALETAVATDAAAESKLAVPARPEGTSTPSPSEIRREALEAAQAKCQEFQRHMSIEETRADNDTERSHYASMQHAAVALAGRIRSLLPKGGEE